MKVGWKHVTDVTEKHATEDAYKSKKILTMARRVFLAKFDVSLNLKWHLTGNSITNLLFEFSISKVI